MSQPFLPHSETHRPPAWSHQLLQCSQASSKGNNSPFDNSDTQPSSTSPSRVFSPADSPSSQSSLSDNGLSQNHDSSSQSSVDAWSGAVPRRQQRLHGPAQISVDIRAKQFNNPRRTQARPSWVKPALIRQDQRRLQLVEQLVDAATQLVVLIWPESDATKACQNRVISLRFFIRETLRRSRTSYSTLQVTLWYLVMIKPHVVESFAQSDECMDDKEDALPAANDQAVSPFGGMDNSKPLQCGRRMFLSALILASKFLQDRNFTARAWSKITGLATQEIISNEFLYLTKISWTLHLKEHDFVQWNRIIIHCTESTQLGRNVKDTWATVLSSIVDKRLTLPETAQVLAEQYQRPVQFGGRSATVTSSSPDTSEPSIGAADFNFPVPSPSLTASTLGDSSSPLVVSDCSRASTPSTTASYPVATPKSMETINNSASPAQVAHHLGLQSSRAGPDPFPCGLVTPSPSSGSDRPDEEGRSFYPSQGFMPTVPMMPSGNDQSSVLNNMVSPFSRCPSFGPKPVHDASNERAMRTSQLQQAQTMRSSVGQAHGRATRPKLSEAEFYAALKQEYYRQKSQRMAQAGTQQGLKRCLTDETDSHRPSKSMCSATALNAPCMTTPVAAPSKPSQD